MKKFLGCIGLLLAATLVCQAILAQEDRAKYVPKVPYPLFKEIGKHSDTLKAAQDSVTNGIRDRQKKDRERRDSLSTELRFDVSHIAHPTSPDEFQSVFHLPPTPQDLTGTCWAFAGTSYMESETFRLSGHKVKLSEMYTVYWEYVEKVRRFVRERGDSRVSAGSEEIDVPKMMKQYGAVPRDQFSGLSADYAHFNHDNLDNEIAQYLEFVKTHSFWDEEAIIATVRILLDKYIGKPPESLVFEGKSYSPLEFVADVLKLHPDDYIEIMSTLKIPFYTLGLFDVGDNWGRDTNYYNLPLDEWYRTLKSAIQKGCSVAIGGGTAEPGYYGIENLGVIPDFDIPQKYITQDSREYRMYRGTTGDDHGLHLVGYVRHGNRDWFLIKDSGSGSRKGKLKGYFFFRDDYIRLKMMTFMVHKDMLAGVNSDSRKRTPSTAK